MRKFGKARWSGWKTAAASALACALTTSEVAAQKYPSHAVQIISGSPAGGGADFVVRMIASKLSQAWGQPVLVENRVGAFQSLAVNAVAKSAPDGYTLLFLTNSVLAMGLRPDLPVNLQRDIAPVALVANGPILLVVNPRLGVTSIRELIDLAKSKPGQLFYGSAGVGTSTHLTGELFNSMAQVTIKHIPYDGGVKAAMAVASGELDVSWPNIAAVKGLLSAGDVRALGISSLRRSPALPDVPTINEAGLPGYEYSSWFGMFGPAGLPKPILGQIHDAIDQVAAAPDVKGKLEEQGFDPASASPEEFAAKVGADLVQFASFAKSVGLDVDALK